MRSCWLLGAVGCCFFYIYIIGFRVDMFDPLPNGDLVCDPKNSACDCTLSGSDHRQP